MPAYCGNTQQADQSSPTHERSPPQIPIPQCRCCSLVAEPIDCIEDFIREYRENPKSVRRVYDPAYKRVWLRISLNQHLEALGISRSTVRERIRELLEDCGNADYAQKCEAHISDYRLGRFLRGDAIEMTEGFILSLHFYTVVNCRAFRFAWKRMHSRAG